MTHFTLDLEADNHTQAILKKEPKVNGVTVHVDPELVWNREGLMKLSAALKGAADLLLQE